MSRFKTLLSFVFGKWYVKYALVCVFGILFVGFLDENSVWAHIKNKGRIAELEDEIVVYQAQYEHNRDQIQQLQHNPKAIERIARERYFMKRADEDIFVLSDDNQEETENIASSHETAE